MKGNNNKQINNNLKKSNANNDNIANRTITRDHLYKPSTDLDSKPNNDVFDFESINSS